MGITFEKFMAIASAARALDVLECWDENTFKVYCEEFGPMTEYEAKQLCRFSEAVTQEELEAAKFFGDW